MEKLYYPYHVLWYDEIHWRLIETNDPEVLETQMKKTATAPSLSGEKLFHNVIKVSSYLTLDEAIIQSQDECDRNTPYN